ncbi:macromolecule degradation protein [Roseibacterium elongatum DSM 19469]|uniref:Macromolecule degradation protein n=1 Tax=Roseicyclus elongatus DSM 19469 TaxID=1294273 RepID=W8S9E9_9RHOB|nr:Xaa-Pro peptidase family protein [Roseibacterium elongatum]AHM05626.1 macromolecule degradation protein [Roseibacterium elongatum DSM 19469]
MPNFPPEEFDTRRSRACAALRVADLDAIVLFAPESQYWLTGYDTFGFAMFQAMVLDADGGIDLLTRLPDLRQAQNTSILSTECIHVWPEVEGADPARDLAALLTRRGLAGRRIGVETRTAGLTHHAGQRLDAALPGLIEASDLIPALRRVKSPAELACIRRAASLSDAALDAALATTGPGAFEGEIHAAMQGAILSAGGEPAANETIIGSGANALLCRSFAGRRVLDDTDQLTLEWSGSWMRYHAAMMRTLVIGTPNAAQRRMHAAAVEALEACEAALVPGRPMADVFEAHARVFDAHGLHAARLQACGYHMGIAYAPIWVEFPMFHAGNPLLLEAGNAVFLHMILMDSASGLAVTLGHSLILGATGPERLSRHDTALIQL